MNSLSDLIKEVELLTFDCYGTLIDWETGIRSALEKLLTASGVTWNDRYFDHYQACEAQLEGRSYQPYRAILTEVESQLLQEAGLVELPAAQLANSLAGWQPFPDTVGALRRLKQRFQLGILSNIDRDLLTLSARHLQVEFDLMITAEDVRSYKPATGHFDKLLSSGFQRHQILHVAQSLFHDIRPCNQLGINCIWVNRRGESNTLSAKPDGEFPDLSSFADAVL